MRYSALVAAFLLISGNSACSTVTAPAATSATHAANAEPRAPSTSAYQASMQKMHQHMMIDYSGNADEDFVRGMIPHHQGAVDMAKIELHYGTDPELRALAGRIIKAQKSEIAFMQDWLKNHPQ